MKLSELIKQERFTSISHETLLNVIVTSNWILSEMSAMMAPFGVTPAQYNVLRILRGSHPATLTCSEIGERLLDRTPDVTRLLNRLERAGLINRERSDIDRRIVEVGITEAGLELLKKMDKDIEELQDSITYHLTAKEQKQLVDLLERMRSDQEG